MIAPLIKIWHYVKAQWKADFHWGYYLSVGLFLSLSLLANYTLNIEEGYIDGIEGWERMGVSIIFFSVAYYFPFVLLGICKGDWKFFTDKIFIGKSLFILFILGVDNGFPYIETIIQSVNPHVYYWVYKIAFNLFSTTVIVLPLFIYHYFFEKNKCYVYGLFKTRIDWSPYIVMLLIITPFIFIVSFTSAFQQQYPMYAGGEAYLFLHVPEWVTVVLYELSYGLDLLTVELLFRGFLVVGMISVLGRAAILPMASVYCFLHFGKPAGEAISSIFGGYLLGIFAFETRSIYGGIAIHVGIAWLMELSAYLVSRLFLL